MSSIAYDTFTAFIMNEDLLQCMLNFLEIEMHEPYLLDYGYYCCSTQNQNKIYPLNSHKWIMIHIPTTVVLQLCIIAQKVHEPGNNP